MSSHDQHKGHRSEDGHTLHNMFWLISRRIDIETMKPQCLLLSTAREKLLWLLRLGGAV